MSDEVPDQGAPIDERRADRRFGHGEPDPLPIPRWVWHGMRGLMLIVPFAMLVSALVSAEFQEATVASAILLYMVFLCRNPQVLLGSPWPSPAQDEPWRDVEIAWLAAGLLALGYVLF